MYDPSNVYERFLFSSYTKGNVWTPLTPPLYTAMVKHHYLIPYSAHLPQYQHYLHHFHYSQTGFTHYWTSLSFLLPIPTSLCHASLNKEVCPSRYQTTNIPSYSPWKPLGQHLTPLIITVSGVLQHHFSSKFLMRC